VALDPRFTPSENAQRYFARYRKAKRGQEEASARLAVTSDLLAQLRLARFEVVDAADEAELAACEASLVSDGLLEPDRRPSRPDRQSRRPQPASSARPAPRRYRTSEGYEVLAGRNSRENDWLTLKSGAPHDLWFHVKDLAGAHVILRRPSDVPVPEEDLREAATIAAYHSEGRESSGVPVDYTERRFVRKAPGGGPGQVLYDHHHTLYVTPDARLAAERRLTSPLPSSPTP
jgi:predicted ribosome quality control (RQC) complex YloA/Tae2 family protein